MVTHDPAAAQRASRILHLDKGKLVGDIVQARTGGGLVKYLSLVFRNARRNPIRSILTIGSLSISLFLSMILISLSTVSGEVASSVRGMNRIVVMSSQGFAQPIPYARVAEIAAMPGVDGVDPRSRGTAASTTRRSCRSPSSGSTRTASSRSTTSSRSPPPRRRPGRKTAPAA